MKHGPIYEEIQRRLNEAKTLDNGITIYKVNARPTYSFVAPGGREIIAISGKIRAKKMLAWLEKQPRPTDESFAKLRASAFKYREDHMPKKKSG